MPLSGQGDIVAVKYSVHADRQLIASTPRNLRIAALIGVSANGAPLVSHRRKGHPWTIRPEPLFSINPGLTCISLAPTTLRSRATRNTHRSPFPPPTNHGYLAGMKGDDTDGVVTYPGKGF